MPEAPKPGSQPLWLLHFDLKAVAWATESAHHILCFLISPTEDRRLRTDDGPPENRDTHLFTFSSFHLVISLPVHDSVPYQLRMVDLSVDRAGLHQICVRALCHDLALVEHQDLVGVRARC